MTTFRLLLLAILLALACSSCAAGGDSGPTQTGLPTTTPLANIPIATVQELEPSPSIPGTVTIWVDWEPSKLAALERILDSYLEIHPGSRFRLVYVPSTELAERFSQLNEAEPAPPTLLVASSRMGPAWYESGLLRPVTEVVASGLVTDIHPLAWSQVELGPEIIGLPFELKGTLLLRNTQLAPTAPSSVEDLIDRAEALQEVGGEGASLDLGFERAAPMLRTCKGELVLDETVDPVLRPAGLCWLRLLNRLAAAGPVTFNSDEDDALFAAGESAWLLGESSQIESLRQILGQDIVAVDGWPQYLPTGEALAGYVWTENLYFPAMASEQDFEASWSFAIYLLAPENQVLLSQARGVGHIPVLTSAELEDPVLRLAKRSLEGGIPLPDFRPLEEIARELGTAARLVAGQGGEPELALELALDEIRKARIPTATPTRTPMPTATATQTSTPAPSPPPG